MLVFINLLYLICIHCRCIISFQTRGHQISGSEIHMAINALQSELAGSQRQVNLQHDVTDAIVVLLSDQIKGE